MAANRREPCVGEIADRAFEQQTARTPEIRESAVDKLAKLTAWLEWMESEMGGYVSEDTLKVLASRVRAERLPR